MEFGNVVALEGRRAQFDVAIEMPRGPEIDLVGRGRFYQLELSAIDYAVVNSKYLRGNKDGEGKERGKGKTSRQSSLVIMLRSRQRRTTPVRATRYGFFGTRSTNKTSLPERLT